MDHRLIFLFVSLAVFCVVVEGRRCGRRKLRICQNQLTALYEDVAALAADDDYPCERAKNVQECFVDYAEDCYRTDGEVIEFLGNNIQEVQGQISDKCADLDSNEVDAALECLQEVEQDASECTETVVAQLMTVFENGVIDPSTIDANKMKCMVFGMIMECVMEKVHERCGEELAQIFREGVEEEAKEIIDACKNNRSPDMDLGSLLKKK